LIAKLICLSSQLIDWVPPRNIPSPSIRYGTTRAQSWSSKNENSRRPGLVSRTASHDTCNQERPWWSPCKLKKSRPPRSVFLHPPADAAIILHSFIDVTTSIREWMEYTVIAGHKKSFWNHCLLASLIWSTS
jgi:hypothetical protein